MENIAIIGGGAVGPLVLSLIAQEVRKRRRHLSGVKIHLIDPKGFGNGGIAYGRCQPEHMLNSIAIEMSPYNPDGFVRFLQKNGIFKHSWHFNARQDFGRFIKENLVTASIDSLKAAGVEFEEHLSAGFIKRNSDGTYGIWDKDPFDPESRLISENVSHLDSDNFVLTVGYGPNTKFQELRQVSGFVHKIYDPSGKSLLDRVSSLEKEDVRVGVIGAGPGLYDVVNELENAPQKLLVFSRAGRELHVRDANIEDEEQSFIPEKLLALDSSSSLHDAEEALRYEFAEAARGRSARRIALDINKSLKIALLKMSREVALQFRKSATFKPIKHLATPIPNQSRQKLHSFSPTFVKAQIRDDDVCVNPDGSFEVTTDQCSYTVDVLINATGHGRHNSPAINALKNQGLACVNTRTTSLDTDDSGYKLSKSGIAVIGPATHVGTDGIESFSVYAYDFVQQLVTKLEKQFTKAPFLDNLIP